MDSVCASVAESSVGELGDVMYDGEERAWLGWSKRRAARSGRRAFAVCEEDEEATRATIDSVCASGFKFRFGSLSTGCSRG